MAEGGGRWALSLAEALALPVPAGRRSALALAHGTMSVRFYAPAGRDEQTPHDQDEIYVVARGRGRFLRAGDRVPFAPGTVLFVPAGVEHRFEDFTDDFATWVVFWGPDGGEGDG
ncbi:MAG TPA: cupin domain-containing protein [Alphaproteobacteria bacterium]